MESKEINEVYAQNFLIMLKDMQLATVRDGKVTSMSEPCDFNMQIEMPGFVNEYEFVYGDKIVLD